MLAIAAYTFNAVSETFIRHHVRTTAPGQTVLICREQCSGAATSDVPVLEGIDPSLPRDSLGLSMINRARSILRGKVGPQASRGQRRQLVAFLKQHKVTAVLAEYGANGVFLVRACAEANVPLYVHFHGVDASAALRRRMWVRAYGDLFVKAAGIIASSRFLADKLAAVGCPEEKLHVSPCGTDPDVFRPTRRIPGRVVAIGRLVEKKAPHLAIEAFGQIAGQFPKARLDVIGDGPLMERCRGLVDRMGLGEVIHLRGAQPPDYVAHKLSEASLFVQHSVTAPNGDTEGLGVSILEAMACEVPVVATRHNGFVETVLEQETGLLVDEFDVDGMAQAMARLLADPARAARMGAAGRERVLSRYTHEHTRDRLRAIMGFPPVGSALQVA